MVEECSASIKNGGSLDLNHYYYTKRRPHFLLERAPKSRNAVIIEILSSIINPDN